LRSETSRRAAGGIGRDDRLDAELADDAPALAERVDVALHRLDVGSLAPRTPIS
jgi:hypothetical protein